MARSSTKISEIKAALKAGKVPSAERQVRRAPLLRGSPILEKNRRAAEKLVTSFLEKAGFDLAKLNEIQTQNQVELQRIEEAQRAEAIRHSSGVKAAFRSAVENRRDIVANLSSVFTTGGVQQQPTVVLDKPFLIWPAYPKHHDDLFFDTHNIESWNSWAKVKVQSKASGYDDLGEVNFYFFWENTSDSYAAINIDTWLMLNGYLEAEVPGSWFGLSPSDIGAAAYLNILEWWNNPPTSPPDGPNGEQYQDVAYVGIYQGTFPNPVTSRSTRVFRTTDLSHQMELVPPHGSVVFEVGANMGYENDSGSTMADFDSGDYEVMCPFLQIQPFLFPLKQGGSKKGRGSTFGASSARGGRR
jgi:hypothetical protein